MLLLFYNYSVALLCSFLLFSFLVIKSIFLDNSPQASEVKIELYYWDYTKIKSFHRAKEIINKTSSPTKWEKIFANNISDKGVNI